ncbi:MAG: antibiotic biosynthesis monooxygenase [Planctomycetaceae bacterium]|nr:antibiotic biosynthesis monooxygenase [Planctomycetaceae bacterium]
MIHVIAEITVTEGQREAFLKEFQAVVPAVHAEEGCIEYGPTVDFDSGFDIQDPARPNVATIVEKWESLDALKAHLVAPHMVEYREKVKGLMQDIKLTVLEPA